jgi:hypothetical protein
MHAPTRLSHASADGDDGKATSGLWERSALLFEAISPSTPPPVKIVANGESEAASHAERTKQSECLHKA